MDGQLLALWFLGWFLVGYLFRSWYFSRERKVCRHGFTTEAPPDWDLTYSYLVRRGGMEKAAQALVAIQAPFRARPERGGGWWVHTTARGQARLQDPDVLGSH